MFDAETTHHDPAVTSDWREHLAWGDVVAYRYPRSERDTSYRPKIRPCVVLDVVKFAGQRYATLAYGTTAGSRTNRGYEIRIARPEALSSIGLAAPTRFVGSRRCTIPLDDGGFSCGDRGTPLLGKLQGDERERLNAVRARIFAEADIAADRRERRVQERRERRASDGAPRLPVVEYRRKRLCVAERGVPTARSGR